MNALSAVGPLQITLIFAGVGLAITCFLVIVTKFCCPKRQVETEWDSDDSDDDGPMHTAPLEPIEEGESPPGGAAGGWTARAETETPPGTSAPVTGDIEKGAAKIGGAADGSTVSDSATSPSREARTSLPPLPGALPATPTRTSQVSPDR